MMRRCIALLSLLMLCIPLAPTAAQTASFTIPMSQGTLLRYRMHAPGDTDTSAVVTWVNANTYSIPMSDSCATGALSKRSLIEGFPNWLPARITARGTVELFAFTAAGQIHQTEYYPSDPPANDTISLYDRIRNYSGSLDSLVSVSLARTLRTFDTTVLDVPSRAFICSIARPSGTDVITIADGWGVIEVTCASGFRLQLSAALIGEVSYNFGSLAPRYAPLAIGNEWQYEVKTEIPGFPDSTKYSVETVMIRSDTIIGGVRYGVQTPSDLSWRRLLRESASGVYQYDPDRKRELLIIPGGSTPGSTGRSALITDAKSEVVFGQAVNTITVAMWFPSISIFDGASQADVHADGFGLIRSLEVGWWDPIRITKTLLYTRIDGREYGTKVGTSVFPAGSPASIVIESYWPQPVSGSTDAFLAFSVSQPMTVHITLCDLLGRTVFASAMDGLGAGAHLLRIPAGTLVCGTYLCVVRAGDMQAQRMMVVVK